MKFAIVLLLACVAVSQAAFTANLVQRAQPALQQALFKVRLASKSSGSTSLVAQLEEQANEMMTHIQEALNNGQEVALSYMQQLQAMAAQLSTLGSNTYQQAADLIGNAWNNLFGQWFGGKSAGKFDFANIVSTISGYIAQAQDLVNNLPALLNLAVQSLFSQFNFGTKKSFSEMWNLLQTVGSNAWDSAQQIAGQVGGIFTGAWDHVQAIAQTFVNEGQAQMIQMTSDAAAQMIQFLTPYQENLGDLYTTIVNQLTGVVSQIARK